MELWGALARLYVGYTLTIARIVTRRPALSTTSVDFGFGWSNGSRKISFGRIKQNGHGTTETLFSISYVASDQTTEA